MAHPAPSEHSESAVLTKAVLRAAARLGVRSAALARTIGVSESQVSRFATGRTLDHDSKPGQLALLFVRLFRSLDALVGGSEPQARAWLHAHHHALGGTPAERIQTPQGLVHVVDYLDALRGR